MSEKWMMRGQPSAAAARTAAIMKRGAMPLFLCVLRPGLQRRNPCRIFFSCSLNDKSADSDRPVVGDEKAE